MSSRKVYSANNQFHLNYLPIKMLAEGSYGKVILAVQLHHIDQSSFKFGPHVAIKIFMHSAAYQD